MLTCVQIHFKGPSRKIGRLLSNMISNVKLKLEITNVNAGLKTSQKVLLPPSLNKLLIVWLGLGI